MLSSRADTEAVVQAAGTVADKEPDRVAGTEADTVADTVADREPDKASAA